MRKIILLVISCGLLVINCFAQEEKVTLTTYYPSPYGSYRELRAQRITIGDNYFGSDYCWPPDACTNQIDTNADLVVEGNVGIGTTNAVSPLTLGNRDSAISVDTSDGSDNKSLLLDGGGGGGSTRGGQVAVYGNEYIGQEGLVLLQAGNNPNRGEVLLTTTGGYLTMSYNGNVGIATSPPNSKLSIGTNGQAGREYLKIDMESGTPPAADCNEQPEGGRMIYDDAGHVIWACDGAGGWKRVGGGGVKLLDTPVQLYYYTDTSQYAGGWRNVDVSAYVSSGATHAILKAYCGEVDMGLRPIGSTLSACSSTSFLSCVCLASNDDEESSTTFVKLDSNKRFQRYIEARDPSTLSAWLVLIGYVE